MLDKVDPLYLASSIYPHTRQIIHSVPCSGVGLAAVELVAAVAAFVLLS